MANVGLIEKQVDTSNVLVSTELLPFQYEAKSTYDIVKRLFDIVSSSVALVVLFPFLVVIAILIIADDNKGSPIFSQYRCGKDGKYFKIYKFRTMCCDAESKLEALKDKNEMDGPVFKIKDDPRVTKVGKFLRSSGIDELPQLFNILKGDMCVVGPRPALPKEVEQYNDEQRIRLKVTPGLTCYWQIEPNRNSITFEEWMRMDRKYIADRSILTDIKIILKTVIAVVKRQGC